LAGRLQRTSRSSGQTRRSKPFSTPRSACDSSHCQHALGPGKHGCAVPSPKCLTRKGPPPAGWPSRDGPAVSWRQAAGPS
jgi:hypothetical protein